MTHQEFKKVVEFLDIKTIQVVVDFKTEFKKFRKLDLFDESNNEMFGGVLSNIRENQLDTYSCGVDYDSKIVFFLDLEDDYVPKRFLVLNDDTMLYAQYQFEDDDIFNKLNHSIIINYNKFIDLIG